MLNSGRVPDVALPRFRTGLIDQWRHICYVRQLQEKYVEATRDILSYQASSESPRRLVRARLSLLGRELGIEIDLDAIEAERQKTREEKYAAFLEKYYNLTKEDAARMMDEALGSSPHQGRKSG